MSRIGETLSPIRLISGDMQVGSLDLESGNHLESHGKRTLLQLFERNAKSLLLLQSTFNYWPCEEVVNYRLHRAFYIFGKILIIFAACSLFFVGVGSTLVRMNKYEMAYTILLCITKLLGFASVLPAQYYNQQRMLDSVKMGEDLQLGEPMRVCRNFGFASTFTVLVAFVLLISIQYFDVLFVFGLFICLCELVTAMYLTFNLLFLLLDIEVSKQLIEDMSRLADTHSLTLSQFNTARNEIHRRVDLSKWATDIIIVPCIASTVTVVVTIFYLDEGRANTIIASAYIASLLKELMFVAVAFYYVAQVNEKADVLTVKLSEHEWYPDAEPQHKADVQRISICTTSIVKPISFTLLFKRLSWQNLAVSAFGFVFTVFVAILKNLIPSF